MSIRGTLRAVIFPLRDINPARSTPVVTYALIALNVLVFAYEVSLEQGAFEALIKQWGMVPYWLSEFRLSSFSTIFSSMFLHGGVTHLVSNMWSLYIFGDNVEDVLGRVRYLVFYLVCGIGAAAAQVAIDPSSQVPMVGASGAIAGVMAAYLKMFPTARVVTLIVFFIWNIPAVFFIAIWFMLQLAAALGSLGNPEAMGGVAIFAHIGGFVAGLYLLARLRPPPNPVDGFGQA